MTEEDEMDEYKIVCFGCRKPEKDDDGRVVGDKPDVKEATGKGNARIRARIHRIKTGHKVETRKIGS